MSQAIAFRVDASIKIGTGHVIRCLTLAKCLKKNGAEVKFFTRPHEGHLKSLIESNGFEVVLLKKIANQLPLGHDQVRHSDWLGTSLDIDANDFISASKGRFFDWIIVDHYALDYRWEGLVRSYAKRLMVIDDLADRRHDCDLLLDQTFGRSCHDYHGLVGKSSELLVGSDHALLRPEFLEFRQRSLNRRKAGQIFKIMICMGGVDLNNATSVVLNALSKETMPIGTEIQVVMGGNAPWIDQVMDAAAKISVPTKIRIGVENMALEMSECDLAIGAGGGTSWERCCLGVPAILIVLAENQRFVAQVLQSTGAVFIIERIDDVPIALPKYLRALRLEKTAQEMQKAASLVVDGMGAKRVIQAMRNVYES